MTTEHKPHQELIEQANVLLAAPGPDTRWESKATAVLRELVEQLEAQREAMQAALDVLHDSAQTWLSAAVILSAALTDSSPASSPSTVRRPLDMREEPAEWYQHADSDPATEYVEDMNGQMHPVSNPASKPEAAGGWCEQHGGYLGRRCATCAPESDPAISPKEST